jgi:hypothetical protein
VSFCRAQVSLLGRGDEPVAITARSVCGTHVAAHFSKVGAHFPSRVPRIRPDAGSNARAGAHFRFWSPVNFGQKSLGTTSQKRGIFGRPAGPASQLLAHVIRGVLCPPEGTASGFTPGILVRPGECPMLVKGGHQDDITLAGFASLRAQRERRLGHRVTGSLAATCCGMSGGGRRDFVHSACLNHCPTLGISGRTGAFPAALA